MKARGLYINTNTSQIVCRGFDKFFNKDENELGDLSLLEYPVTVYLKENGFLGLVGYNDEFDELVITSKSDLNGPYAQYVKDALTETVGADGLKKIKKYVKQHKCTLALEICDPVRDPHIIEYPEIQVYLLAIIHNTKHFAMESYTTLRGVAQQLCLRPKKKVTVLNSYEELNQFLSMQFGHIEGFVFEDVHGFMIKYKTDFYNLWKHRRSLVHSKNPQPVNQDDHEFLEWLNTHDIDHKLPIIEIRKLYEK